MTATAPTTPLHPRLADIAVYMADTREQLVAYSRSLTGEQLSFRAAPDRWNALDVLEHLCISDESCGRLFASLAKQLREAGSPMDAATDSMLHCIDQFNVPTAPQRITAPERLIPTGQLTVDEALDRLANSRARLIDAIERANGLALDTVSFPHPLFGPIHAYGWLVFIAHHELRHMRQMRENLAAFSA